MQRYETEVWESCAINRPTTGLGYFNYEWTGTFSVPLFGVVISSTNFNNQMRNVIMTSALSYVNAESEDADFSSIYQKKVL